MESELNDDPERRLLFMACHKDIILHSLVLSTISSGEADVILCSLLLPKVSSGGSHAPKRLLRGALVFVNL